MQDNRIKAFRQRLVRAGFTDICITNSYRDFYYVSCVTPEREHIRKIMSITQIVNTPRVVWFND